MWLLYLHNVQAMHSMTKNFYIMKCQYWHHVSYYNDYYEHIHHIRKKCSWGHGIKKQLLKLNILLKRMTSFMQFAGFPSATFLISLYLSELMYKIAKIITLIKDYYLCFLWVEVLCLTVSAMSIYFRGIPYCSNQTKKNKPLYSFPLHFTQQNAICFKD